ncbi:MAG TPA: cytidine deaminase, partial [Gemmatimonadales bacterium]
MPGSDSRLSGSRDRRKGDRRQQPRRARDRRSGVDRRAEAGWEALTLETVIAGPSDEAGLVAAAIDARTRARAEFSGFKVGAALEAAGGEVITGCNVENATYGLTMCAERVALFKALSEDRNVFTRIVVVADTSDPTPPCGSCRQLLWEYCGDIEVVLANLAEVKSRLRLSELLPRPFDARLLK